jgi:8-oxo-dGTP pyrophosphatase MutT (NUDIX family)
VILLRDGPDGPEVLLVERNPAQRFMGCAWVFPGGGADAASQALLCTSTSRATGQAS